MTNNLSQSLGKVSHKAAVTCLGALMLMLIAFYDNYPIVTNDTGSYIESGCSITTPPDRPIVYGLFVYLSSLGLSLWLTVFAQCLIVALLIIRFIRRTAGSVPNQRIVAFFLFTSVGTIGGWHCSQLMPDIFTAILVLSIINYLFLDDKRGYAWVYLSLMILAVLMHNSHLVTLTLLVLCLFLSHLAANTRIADLRKTLTIAIVCLLSWTAACTVNYIGGNGFRPSKATHIFLMGKLVENGVLKTYLDKACPVYHYNICTYKDSLPAVAWEFVWDNTSPLYRTGGWEANREEYNNILKDISTRPKYWVFLGYKSLEGTLRELSLTGIDESYKLPWTVFDADTPPFKAIQKYIPHELNEFVTSRQNTKTLNIPFLDKIYIVVLVLSSILVLLTWKIKNNGLWKGVFVILTLMIVLNAFVCANMANVLTRLNSRIIWLLPVFNTLLLCDTLPRFFMKRKAIPGNNT